MRASSRCLSNIGASRITKFIFWGGDPYYIHVIYHGPQNTILTSKAPILGVMTEPRVRDGVGL